MFYNYLRRLRLISILPIIFHYLHSVTANIFVLIACHDSKVNQSVSKIKTTMQAIFLSEMSQSLFHSFSYIKSIKKESPLFFCRPVVFVVGMYSSRNKSYKQKAR